MADTPTGRRRWIHIADPPQFIVGLLTLGALGLYTWYSSQQVTASDTANKIASQALGEVNKPYIMFSSLSPHLTQDKNGIHKQAGLSFINYGNTPALNPTIYVCKPIIKETQGSPPYKCDLADPPAKVNAIGPKQPITFNGPIITDSDLDASKDERKFIYLFGFLEYNDKIDVDPYGNIKRRVTSFCVRIVQPSVVDVNSTTKQVPNSTAEISPANGAQPNATNLLEPQFIGLGCQDFAYCLDEECPVLPKQ